MMSLLARVLWMAIPAIVAGVVHMAVVKKNLFARLAVPLDGGATLGRVPIFGPKKTWRGVCVMVAASALVGALQGAAFGGWAHAAGAELVDFAALGRGSFALGYAAVAAVFGLGYVLGELPNSFLKRRAGISPGVHGRGLVGAFFFTLDQCDSVLVGLALGAVVFGYGWTAVLAGTVSLSLVHLGVTAVLHRTRIKENL
jgi:hypothetical protein